jgi:hypothetical protein
LLQFAFILSDIGCTWPTPPVAWVIGGAALTLAASATIKRARQ